jgi:MGT family glycosyltransferase
MYNKHQFAGKRILFATVPAEGHVNPLTGLAMHLQQRGCDVRWYTSITFADKMNKLDIKHYPFVKALDANSGNLSQLFPQRNKITRTVGKINFDMIHLFSKRSDEYYEDIKDIYKTFPFDIMIADCMFTAIPFVKEKMKIPAVAVGVIPLSENSKDLAPYGLGLTPANTRFEKIKHSLLRFISDKVLLKKSIKVYSNILKKSGINKKDSNLFDFIIKNASLVLQSGTPGFEYYRSDIGKNIRFVGPLLPYAADQKRSAWFDERIKKYKKILLVTQGTVEKDISKLIVPTLEAFKHTDVLVIVTTGGQQTTELKEKYDFDNVIIEDFIPFQDIMPYTSVFVTNGGYGGVLLSIRHGLPIVAAGIHEGKNEICARIGFFKYGINLNTETPTPAQLRVAVEEVTEKDIYVKNVRKLSKEFELYNANELSTGYIGQLLNKN